MAKINTTKMHKTNTKAYYPLVAAGYIVFALLVLSVLLSTTIPFGSILFQPEGVRRFNVGLFLVMLTIGGLLPTILGYVIGDHAVKTKRKISHHFNGVLFGLLAFWIMLILGSGLSFVSGDILSDLPGLRLVAINIIPSIGVVIVASLIAIAHAKSRQAKKDIIEYKPYGITLAVSIMLLPVISLVSVILSDSSGMNAYTILPFVVPIVFGVIAYITLRKVKLSAAGKLAWVAVSVSMAYAIGFVLTQLVPAVAYFSNATPTVEVQAIISSIGWVLSLVGWIWYWVVQVKAVTGKE